MKSCEVKNLKNERKCRAGRSKGCLSKLLYEFPKENAKLIRGEDGPIVGVGLLWVSLL
jgi:hypothetical protein